MPTICRYEGYTIAMRLRSKEHEPPHVHISYGEKEAVFSLETGEMIDGMIPKKGQAWAKRFIIHYKDRLYEMWEKQNYERLDPVE